MAARPTPDDVLDETDRLVRKYGTVSQAARALGIPDTTMRRRYSTFRRRIAALEVQAAVKEPPTKAVPAGFEVKEISSAVDKGGNVTGKQFIRARLAGEHGETVPEGHLVKGYSTLVDETGAIRAQWIKTTLDQDQFRAMTLAACRAAAEAIQPISNVKAPQITQRQLLTQYTLTDCHVGMLAWGTEAGEPWDLKIAEEVLTKTFDAMVDGSPCSDIAIVNQQGDFLHFDSMKPVTPEHGHILDADSRYQKVVEVAVRIMRRVIEKALRKHRKVKVLMNEGNHDMAGSVWLRVMFKQLYADNPRVTVEGSPLPYVVHQHGATMLCYHHGHLAKNDNLPLLFAARFPEMWGATKKRYIHVGHRHSVDEKEHPGVKVIQHPTLAAADAYAARGGWLSERQATAITYHRDSGEFSRGIYLPAG